MPSRKRNKRKERKAKKAEARLSRTNRTWQEWSLWGLEYEQVQCDHGGITNIPNSDHLVKKFVDIFIEDRRDDVNLVTSLQTLLTTIPQVWKEETLRNEAVGILTSIATNQILHAFYFGADSLCQSNYISKAIIALDSHNLITDDDIVTIFYHPLITAKFKNLNDDPQASGKRDILKFLSRRISCSCLKDMHRQARLTIPKTRHCSYCREIKERDELMLCGGCRISGYCSIECQAADWEEEHSTACRELSGYQRAYANQKITASILAD